VTPAPDAAEVDINSPILVSFNRPVVPVVSTEAMDDLAVPLLIEPLVQGVGEWLNTSMYLFTPSESLGGSTKYTVTVRAGLTAVDGAELAKDYTWNFTTVTPHIVSISPGVPEEGYDYYYTYYEDNVPLDTPITVTFSQPMDHGSTEAAFALTAIESEERVAGTFDWNNDSTEFTFQPDNRLSLNTNVEIYLFPDSYVYVAANYRVSVAPTARTQYGNASLTEGSEEIFPTVPLPGVCGVSYERRRWDYDFSSNPVVPPGGYPIVVFCSPMNLQTLEERIIIEPAPEKWELVAFSDEGSTAPLLFNTKRRTTYTVTVLAGTEDVYGNAIAEDYTFSFTTGELPTYAYPMLSDRFYAPFRYITSAYRENTAFPLAISGTPSVEFELYEFPLLGEPKPIRAWTEELDSGDYGDVTASVNLASQEGGTLPTGLYRLKLSYPAPSGPEVNEVTIAVATANITVKRSTNDLLIWVTDLESGQPIPEAPVFVYHGDTLIAEGITETDGILRLPVNLTPDTEYQQYDRSAVSVITQADGLFGLWDSSSEPVIPGERATIYTDRAIYRPGETVYFRGVLRDRWDVDYSVPQGIREVPITINAGGSYYGGGTTLFDGSVPVSKFGTFSGEFTLPDDVELGNGFINTSFGTAEHQYVPFLDDQPYSWQKNLFESEYNRTYNTYVMFTIAEYRVPEFKVEVTAQQDSILQGDVLNATVNAEYYSGGALGGAQLQWETAGCPTVFQYAGPGSYTFTEPIERDIYWYYAGYNDNCAQFGDANLRNRAGERSEDWYRADFESVRLGADGRYLVSSDKTIADSGYPTLIVINATVTDESDQAISGQTVVMAHPANVYTGIKTDRYFYRAEEPVTVDLLAVTPQSDLIANQVIDVTIVQVDWKRMRTDDGEPYWDEVETPVESGQVVADSTGRAQYVFTPTSGGVFKVRTHATDEAGRSNGSAVRFYVSDNSRAALWKPAGESLEVIPDKDTYLPGDTAQILIPLPGDGPGTVLLTAERTTILAYDVIEVDGGALVYELPITDLTTGVTGDVPVVVMGISVLITGDVVLRAEPDSASAQLTILPPLVVIPVLERLPDTTWIKVNYRGAAGWVAEYLTRTSANLEDVPISPQYAPIYNTRLDSALEIIPLDAQIAQIDRLLAYVRSMQDAAWQVATFWQGLNEGKTMECRPPAGDYTPYTITARDRVELPELRRQERLLASAVVSLNDSIAAMRRCGVYTPPEISAAYGDAVNAKGQFAAVEQNMENLRDYLLESK
jgi:hypothetical protein